MPELSDADLSRWIAVHMMRWDSTQFCAQGTHVDRLGCYTACPQKDNPNCATRDDLDFSFFAYATDANLAVKVAEELTRQGVSLIIWHDGLGWNVDEAGLPITDASISRAICLAAKAAMEAQCP